MSRAWFKELLSHYSLLSLSFLPDTVLRLGEQTPKWGGALGDSSLNHLPQGPASITTATADWTRGGTWPRGSHLLAVERSLSDSSRRIWTGRVSLLGRVSQWFSEEQRKEAERKKKETDNWEKQRWEKQKFPQKDIGSESPWCGLPTWFPSRQGCWESPDFGASEMNPAKKHKRTYTHVHIPHVHSFLLFLCSPLPHLNNFQNGKSQRRLSLLSGCKSWETEMNHSGQQNFWREQREEVAGCRRENTGAQISWGISQSVCTVVWDLNSKTSLKSPHLPSQFCSLPCQLHSYRLCPLWLARQWLQQLLEPQQPLITANRCLGLGSPRNRPWDKDLNMSSLLGSDHRKQWSENGEVSQGRKRSQ